MCLQKAKIEKKISDGLQCVQDGRRPLTKFELLKLIYPAWCRNQCGSRICTFKSFMLAFKLLQNPLKTRK